VLLWFYASKVKMAILSSAWYASIFFVFVHSVLADGRDSQLLTEDEAVAVNVEFS